MATLTRKPSPARMAANRANAQKSTGPRTEAGKARSRANAVKHGLTGAGVALAGEDAARIEAEFLQAQEEFAATTLAGMRLVREVAMLWVRQDRARQFEATSLDARARRAGADFDQARSERADGLVDTIEANPRATRRALLAMPEGVDRLIDGLTMLLGEITGPAPAWSPAHHKRLDALFGYRVGDLPWNRPTRFSKAILGDYEAIGDAEVAGVPPNERQVWAIERLSAAIGAEVARLAEHRTTIDRDRIAEDRTDAIARASLDLSKDGVLAQRYIAAAARDLSRALRDFHLVESAAGTDPEATLGAEPTPDPIAESEPTPTPNDPPDPPKEQPVTTPLASFGESAPVVLVASPAAAMSASIPAVQSVPTVDPAAFSPSFRQ